HVELREASRIEQPLEPLPRRQLARVVLPAHPLRTAHARDALFALAEIVDAIRHNLHLPETRTREQGNAGTRYSALCPSQKLRRGYCVSSSRVPAIPRSRDPVRYVFSWFPARSGRIERIPCMKINSRPASLSTISASVPKSFTVASGFSLPSLQRICTGIPVAPSWRRYSSSIEL